MSPERVREARRRWQLLWNRLGVPSPDDVRDAVIAEYQAPHRHDHTLDHVLDCLEILDRHRGLAERPLEIELAIWFRDAVYDTRRDDNESASADWAIEALRSAGLATAPIDRVKRMILATCDHESDTDADGRLMLDIDLSILGRAPDRFQEYEAQVRSEFDWVREDAFRAGRLEVLSTFLERTRLFSTDALFEVYEAQARSNLERSVAQLSPSLATSSTP